MKTSLEISVSLDPVSGKEDFKDYIKWLNTVQGISIHLDVMDGAFVPRMSCTPEEFDFVVTNSVHPIDVHLMIENPERDLDKYLSGIGRQRDGQGIRSISFHVETQPSEVTLSQLKKIRRAGIMPGIIVDLPTILSLDCRDTCGILGKSDVVTVMSVKCGASGQSFNQDALDKIRMIKEINPMARVIVDGGVKMENIAMVEKAGADIAVMGSAVYSNRLILKQLLDK